MSPMMRKGVLVAALHASIVASLGAKLVVDRATRPRVWARATPIDPNLPIRGRYVQLSLEATAGPDLVSSAFGSPSNVVLVSQEGRAVAVPASDSDGLSARTYQRVAEGVTVLDQPLAYFIPEHVADPSRRPTGEELWVEVTIPRRGAPRPIRLGVKKDGVLTPLDLNEMRVR